MPSAVGGGASALGLALAVIGGHAAEGALQDLAVVGARERHAPMLELVNGFGGVAAEIFDGVLVAEPVGALDGVVHMPAPIVRAHIAERSRDAALGSDSMRAGGEDLGDAGGAKSGLARADHGAKPGTAGADHDDVVGMVDDRIGAAVDGRCGVRCRVLGHGQRQTPKPIFRIAKPQTSTRLAAKKVASKSDSTFKPFRWTSS